MESVQSSGRHDSCNCRPGRQWQALTDSTCAAPGRRLLPSRLAFHLFSSALHEQTRLPVYHFHGFPVFQLSFFFLFVLFFFILVSASLPLQRGCCCCITTTFHGLDARQLGCGTSVEQNRSANTGRLSQSCKPPCPSFPRVLLGIRAGSGVWSTAPVCPSSVLYCRPAVAVPD